MSVCTPYAFELGAWAAMAFAFALVGGYWLVVRLRRVPEQNLEEEDVEQLTFDDVPAIKAAIARSDEICATVEKHNPEWMDKAVAAYFTLPLAELIEITGEGIRIALVGDDDDDPNLPRLIALPHSKGVWGALTKRLIKAKHLKWTGEMRPMTGKKANGRRTFVYEILTVAPVAVQHEMETV